LPRLGLQDLREYVFQIDSVEHHHDRILHARPSASHRAERVFEREGLLHRRLTAT
jgi:hypothetical protein